MSGKVILAADSRHGCDGAGASRHDFVLHGLIGQPCCLQNMSPKQNPWCSMTPRVHESGGVVTCSEVGPVASCSVKHRALVGDGPERRLCKTGFSSGLGETGQGCGHARRTMGETRQRRLTGGGAWGLGPAAVLELQSQEAITAKDGQFLGAGATSQQQGADQTGHTSDHIDAFIGQQAFGSQLPDPTAGKLMGLGQAGSRQQEQSQQRSATACEAEREIANKTKELALIVTLSDGHDRFKAGPGPLPQASGARGIALLLTIEGQPGEGEGDAAAAGIQRGANRPEMKRLAVCTEIHAQPFGTALVVADGGAPELFAKQVGLFTVDIGGFLSGPSAFTDRFRVC